MDGIIIVNKHHGITSHGVVNEIRKIFPGLKAGHSGTLDPMAAGVLPVCLGRATRVVEYIIELPKVYRAAIILGKTTDTEDVTGRIIDEKAVPCLERKDLETVLKKFVGIIEQSVPSYSAVKHRGKPFYYWARRGETVPQRIRSTEIYNLKLLEFRSDQEPHLVFDVECSKGTYVRTLAADIGRAIGCGAHLFSLTRFSVGPYMLKDALTTVEIADKAMKGCYDEFILGMDTAVQQFPRLVLTEEQVKDLKNGRIIFPDQEDLPGQITDDNLFRVYDSQGSFRAIAVRAKSEGNFGLKTVKYLAE